MLKTITKNILDVFAGFMMIAVVFLPCGDNSHNAAARKCFEPRQRICVSVYECSGHLRRMADFIVLGLVLFLLMPLKGRKFLRKGPLRGDPFYLSSGLRSSSGSLAIFAATHRPVTFSGVERASGQATVHPFYSPGPSARPIHAIVRRDQEARAAYRNQSPLGRPGHTQPPWL